MPERSTPELVRNSRGVWMVRWYVRDMAGGRWDRRERSLRTEDRTEAEARFGEWLVDGGASAKAARPRTERLVDVVAAYLEEKAGPEGNGKTQALCLAAPLRALGTAPAKSIDAKAAKEFTALRLTGRYGPVTRRRTPISPSTVRRELNALQAALNWRYGASLVLPKPPETERRKKWLTEAETKRMLAALEDEDVRLRAFVKQGLLYGARRGAILGLEWSWGVDWSAGLIQYQNPVERANRKRKPLVRIHPLLRPDLEALHEATGGEGRVLRGRVEDMLTDFMARSGLAGTTPHVLKHTMATLSIRAGLSLFDISEICRTDERTLRRSYVHEDATRAAKNVGAWMER